MEDFEDQLSFDDPFFSQPPGLEINEEENERASCSQSLLSFPVKAHAPPPASEASTRSNLCLKLNAELRAVAASNPKFEAFPPHRIFDTANLLVAYGITTLEAFRTTDEIARRYLMEDLRKNEKLNFLQLAFLFKLARHIPPHDQKVSEKNMRFTELDIPKALEKYAPKLGTLSAYFLPDQDQVNWCRKEIAIAAAKDPPFKPYLVPKLYEPPWMPSDSEHSTARTRWSGYAKQAKRASSPQEMTIQAFSLYHLRFLFAADLCQAFQSFGGLGPQLSHYSTVLHLSITESIGISLAYHRLIGQKLQEKARKRTVSESDFITFLAAENITIKEHARKEIISAIDSDVKEKELKRKASGKGKKGDKGSHPRGKNDSYNVDEKPKQDLYYRKETDVRKDDGGRNDSDGKRERSRSRNKDKQQKYGPNRRQQGKGRNQRN